MNPISVNAALGRLTKNGSECIAVEGILCFEIENISLLHWPKAERCSEGYQSSIWIDADGPAFDFDQTILERWAGKRVVVLGTAERAEKSTMDGWELGFGHFGIWNTRIRARRIDLLKHWKNDHPETEKKRKRLTI